LTAIPPRDTRRAGAPQPGAWRDQFRFDHVKVLVVCRGPIRLEAIEAFERLGTQPCGMLLSEKDSVVYPRALAPELRQVGRNERVHRIPDYAGTTAAQKAERIGQILSIARQGGYTHIFAGYGFMAEDHEFIGAIEAAGLGFVGPSTGPVRKAGAKDAAKALAREIGVSVTPGVDNIEALTLLAQAGGEEPRAFLSALARRHELGLPAADEPPPLLAERLLSAARARKRELITLAQLQAEAERRVRALLAEHPGRRLRLKHVGGGGGKGQRIVSAPEQVGAAVTEVLNEARATGPGDQRNFLIELNIETTRHNEIQLLGNGQWCVALGGRDCSLQMHEQKLLEVSVTEELLAEAAQRYDRAGKREQSEVLRADLAVLREMEAQAARFGEAVGLDSASTFESIVDGPRHYFMEVNTRIQVEHRVTEMVYSLRFTHPQDAAQSFTVESLVEAMLWCAVHGAALPRPERIPRHGSGAEVRLNATNDALKPHAGGVVLDWSPPQEHELRDDQGIGIRNPDTQAFMPYQLAGAYDSNVALVVTHGRDREENFRRLVEILRVMDLRGHDLMTNLGFHYGLLHWMLGADPLVKPSTRFVTAYLAGVGALRRAGADVDLDRAWDALLARQGALSDAAAQALEMKRTLVLRPLRRLYRFPHLLAGWLAPRAQRRFVLHEGRVVWRQNRLEVLEQLYRYLHLEEHPGASPEERIWAHDQALLSTGLAFYRDLRERLGEAAADWDALRTLLEADAPPEALAQRLPAERWPAVQAAHRGHQAGLELLELPVLTGAESGFYGIGVDARLEVVMPAAFAQEETAAPLRQALEVAPRASSDEVVAFTGGTFYARPSPEDPPYVTVGEHVEEGQVLGLLEVMKMFNPVRAAFDGTVRAVQVHGETGQLVLKGQTLFVIEPDVPIVHETEEQVAARRRSKTDALLARL
jgi:acetyl/propionyl-CoA carboxylase alpha subunit